jgi:hypothetical protein
VDAATLIVLALVVAAVLLGVLIGTTVAVLAAWAVAMAMSRVAEQLGHDLRAAQQRRRQRVAASQAAWRDAAQRHGWARVGGSEIRYVGHTPRGAGLRASAESQTIHQANGPDTVSYWLELRIGGVAPPGRLFPAALFTFGRDQRTGATAFDRAVQIDIDPEHLPRLGHRFQAALLEAQRQGVEVRLDRGDLVVSIREELATDARLQRLVHHAYTLEAALGDGPIDELLVEEVRHAPDPGFRLRCLEQLAPLDAPRARTLAAGVVQEPGIEPELAAHAHLLLDQPVRALQAGRGLPARRLTRLLHRVEAMQRTDLGGDLVPLLTEWLEHPDVDVVIAAATVLRSVGTVAAVPALKATADGVGLLGSGRKEAACRQAVAAIQARATGSAGDVSLAQSTTDGALSAPAPRRPSRELER